MLAMLSALSLFHKNCDRKLDPDSQPSWAMVLFTAIFGLVVLLVWWFWSGNHHDNANQFEPDAEPDARLAHNPAVHDEDVEMSVAAEAEPQELQRREPNAEDYVSWLIERCK